jgi:hypothetical protein
MKKQLLFMLIWLFVCSAAIAQITTVGLIGSATPNGWDSDIDMVQDATDTCIWTLDVTLVAGEAKFRANDGWDINWGSSDFPSGTAIQGGSNIPVFAGDYSITFNSCTGEYVFVVESPIGIIGDATPGGWDEDTNMFKDTTEHGFFVDIDLTVGGAKFRKDDGWDVNWGSADFPSGVGTQGGDNIAVSKAGKYHITFDTLSGVYNFEEKVDFEFIGLIGDATPGGWDTDTDLTQDANNPDQWQADVTLSDGSFKFRANHAWTLNWGGTEFPTGTAVVNGDNIVPVPGTYRVIFNTNTLEYSFLELGNYNLISLIGDAAGGWDVDLDLTQDVTDSTIWKGSFELFDGEAKFRADHAWDANWGSSDFPFGTGVQGGANIPVVAGEYNVTFNTLTGDYSFEVFVVYDQISIVGKDGPFGAWPDDTPDFDTYMTVSPDDDQFWTASGVTLTTADTTAGDSGIKFRANTDWTVNWGDRAFPAGTGTPSGPNIWCTEGTYDVSLNSLTGEYVFGPPDATVDFINPSSINVYPNPTSQELNIDISDLDLGNEIIINVYDINGKLITKQVTNAKSIIKLNTSTLQNGNYLMNISGNGYMIGKKFSVVK